MNTPLGLEGEPFVHIIPKVRVVFVCGVGMS